MFHLVNADCFDDFKNIKKNSVNMVLVDLPYGETSCAWDDKIDLKKMWVELKRVCVPNANLLFFCSTKYGVDLINSNPSWFRYDLVYEKKNIVGFLNAKKCPLRKHEMIYYFKCSNHNDKLKEHNLTLRAYSKQIRDFTNLKVKDTFDLMLNNNERKNSLSHFLHYDAWQFRLPKERPYKILCNEYKLQDMKGYMDYEEMDRIWKSENMNTIYNPIMIPCEPYLYHNKGSPVLRECVYGVIAKSKIKEIRNEKYPTSIIRVDDKKNGGHPTEKSVGVCEWLIKTYSNEGDLILDFTCGIASTGVACINTNRRFYGIEKNKTYYEVGLERLNKTI